MSEVTALIAWIISILKIAVFGAVFTFSVVLVRVSKLKELTFFSLAAFSFMISSLFELITVARFLDASLEIIDTSTALLISKVFLIFAAVFLFFFFYYIYKNVKSYM